MKRKCMRNWMGYVFGFYGLMPLASLQAATSAVTTPVGFISGSEVDAGNPHGGVSGVDRIDADTLGLGTNLYGIRLHHKTLTSGRLGEFGMKDVELRFVETSTHELPLVKGSTYILEIVSGDQNGVIQEITEWQGLRVKLPEALQNTGVKTGDAFTLRKAPTLDEIFDPRITPLQGAEDPAAADRVLIPRGVALGDFQACYLLQDPQIGRIWMDLITNKPVGQIPLVYADGLIIQRVNPQPINLPCHGEIKTGPTRHLVQTGLNLVATPYPGGASLQQLGLQGQLQQDDDPAKADKIWLPVVAGGGEFNHYFMDSTGAWINAGTGETISKPLLVGSAILIERLGKPALFTLGDKTH